MEKIYFADNLKRLMKKHGMNQKDIAKIAGVSQQTVSLWLSGDRIPRMGKIQILADYFGIYKSELIEERNEENEARIRRLARYMQIYRELSPDEIDEMIKYAELIKSKRK